MYIFFVLVVHKTAPNLVLSLSEIKCPRAPFFFCYADDLAAVVTAGHCDELRIKGSSTLRTIRAWMAMNDLRIAENKTKAVLLKTQKGAKSVFFEVGEFRIYPSPAVNYLGVNIGQRISFKEHVKSVVNKARKTSRAISMLLPNVRGPATNKRKVLYRVSPKKDEAIAPLFIGGF
jgi:hypothetical protein